MKPRRSFLASILALAVAPLAIWHRPKTVTITVHYNNGTREKIPNVLRYCLGQTLGTSPRKGATPFLDLWKVSAWEFHQIDGTIQFRTCDEVMGMTIPPFRIA